MENEELIIQEITNTDAVADKIVLVMGVKGTGKSTYIIQKYEELKSSCDLIGTYNSNAGDPDNMNTIIYILKDKCTNEIIILNSGSDEQRHINYFRDVLAKYPKISTVYTAIRPEEENPKLHKWMKEALSIW